MIASSGEILNEKFDLPMPADKDFGISTGFMSLFSRSWVAAV